MSELFFTAGAVATEIARRLATIRQLVLDGEGDPIPDDTALASAETNIGRKVMRGRRRLPADEEVPCIIIAEGPDTVEDRPGRAPQVYIQQTYTIDAFDACDPDNPNDKAHAMIRDIKRAIFSDGTTLGGQVKACDYVGRDIGPRPDGVALVQARVVIGVSYVETLHNP